MALTFIVHHKHDGTNSCVGSVGDFQDVAVFGLAWKLSLLLSFPLVVAEKVLVSEISKIKSENGSVKSAAGF